MFQNTPAFAGHRIGNGGNGVYCSPSATNAFDGYYFWDYLVAAEKKEFTTVSEANYQKRLDRLTDTLRAKGLSDIAQDFETFMQSFLSASSKRYTWTGFKQMLDLRASEDPFALETVTEKCIKYLPNNCLMPEQTPSISRPDYMPLSNPLFQAVIRVDIGNKTHFYYDQEVVDQLTQNKDQLSWLAVHEWLWEHLSSSAQIEDLNAYLHSQEFEDSLPEDAQSRLEQVQTQY
jgi:hypothetical protein